MNAFCAQEKTNKNFPSLKNGYIYDKVIERKNKKQKGGDCCRFEREGRATTSPIIIARIIEITEI